jgi:hypothetical protein
MAEKVEFYKQKIIDAKNSRPELSELTSDSKVSNWGNFAFIVAACTAVFDQLLDLFRIDIDKKVYQNTTSTNTNIAFVSKNLFQYDPIVNQVLVVDDNFIVSYETPDVNKRIITRCSVTTLPDKQVVVQVAKNEPPEQLTSSELIAFSGFLDNYLPAGVSFNAASGNSDKVLIEADVYYFSGYSATVVDDLIAAIDDYLRNIDENGYLVVSDLHEAMLNSEGVKSVVLKKVYLRADVNTLANATKIYDLALGINIDKERFSSGYAVTETTSGSTINETLTYIGA